MVNSMVERATSDMLIGPDWAMNIEISDMLNQDPGQAKDIVKGIKRKLGSKNPKVQLLALTLLETIIKNCGDVVHMHVAEKNVLQDMVKIVKKKPDYRVREKVLSLIDTWQEAFGGARARYPQYYAAYQELLRLGAVFPPRSEGTAPVLTPPQSHPLSSYTQNVRSPRFNHGGDRAEPSAEAEYPTLSLSELQNARGSVDVLAEMLNAVDPGNEEGLRQEALVDLVEQCRNYKQRVVHLVNSTSDESLLCQGLALNDDLQRVLAKYESILSGDSVQAEKPKDVPTIRDLVDVNAGESSKHANEGSNSGAKTSDLLSLSAPATANGTTTVPKADPKMDLLSGDLLGGDDFSSPTQNSMALVPVSVESSSSPVTSEQNALALVDMFSAGGSTQTPNGPPAFSAGSEFQQQQQASLYQNGTTPNMGSPFDQQGYPQGPQAPSPSWGAQSVHPQQQPSSPAYGTQNGDSLPPPPWESPATDSQPFGAPNAPQAQPPTLPAAGNGQFAGPYGQPIPGSQPFQMPMYPHHMMGMTPMYPQPMYSNPLPGYSAQLPGYGAQLPGYGAQLPGYGAQLPGYGYEAQYLEQRMHGLSVSGGAPSQASMASYLPPMKKQPQGDDKLFGDLVNMAKMKPQTKSPPDRAGSM